MTIKEVAQQLETATAPIIKILHKGAHHKVLVLGFKKGMRLKEHVAQVPSKLTVIAGEVIYTEEDKALTLHEYEEVDIPLQVLHAVEAVDNSICLLIQGA